MRFILVISRSMAILLGLIQDKFSSYSNPFYRLIIETQNLLDFIEC